ncbi:cytochrome c1 [Enterovirga sp.]|jgi:cytochrome c1|uniref:cytochrome c1 n=1 Tax=Enterovirga sp. TaxID=2026350 RepID=UPI00260C3E54|nr:cytochrome c1 [Enterovirga sp.]MDB5591399.1 cytochrome c1 [Enterovirga sp.]
MTSRRFVAALALGFGLALSQAASAAEGTPQPPRQSWTFSGISGTFDRAQLQRGFKVYREACQACHQLKIPFRTLAQNGGPQFSTAQVTALAAEYKVQDGPNDAGDMFERPARPADNLPWTFPNENAAAAANGGKAPPPLQLIAKARGFERGFPWFVFDAMPFLSYQEHGVDYVKALLVGYEEPPAGVTVPPGGHYNKYFPGHVIAMPKPLNSDGQIEYPKGPDGKSPVPETVDQYARDVSAFLMWAAEPHLEQRKRTGFMALIFLAVLGAGMWYAKKKVWAKVGGEAEGLPGTAPLGPTG